MTRRRKLETHYQSLLEIREIMNSMKTLAYMETHKLNQCMQAQKTVVNAVEAAAADLVSFHPEVIPQTNLKTINIIILIGAERGFCGDFNQALQQFLETDNVLNNLLIDTEPSHLKLITIGQKLFTQYEKDERVLSNMDGASVAEDIPNTLQALVAELMQLQQQLGVIKVYCCYHQTDTEVICRQILPPFLDMALQKPTFSYPPLLNVDATELFVNISEQYLFAVLHQMLYVSLMAENNLRVTHLDGAIRHLDEQCETLKRKSNTLRQEEIVEEIEVILLSATSLNPSADQ